MLVRFVNGHLFLWCLEDYETDDTILKEFLKWRLFDLPLVDRWYHPSGKAALLGDACHPMLPYMASGAAMAVEDAAVLRALLKNASPKDIPAALARYQQIRQPRASAVQKAGRYLQYTYHLPDGEEQETRDRLMVQDVAENPVFWGHETRRNWLFGADVEDFEKEAQNGFSYGKNVVPLY